MKKILLIHQYAGNKGDRAVLYCLCKLIQQTRKDVKIVVSTSSPELYKNVDFYESNAISFINNSWSFPDKGASWKILGKLKKYTFTLLREAYLLNCHKFVGRLLINPTFYKECTTADKIISVGGHHFTTLLSRDLVSSINYDAMSVSACGKTFTCFSQSFGPFQFHKKHNKQLTSKLLSSTSIYIRDNISYRYLQELLQKEKVYSEIPETVLSFASFYNDYIIPSKRKKQIGIAIYCTQSRSEEELETYTNTIAALCNHIVSTGNSVLFFPMELKGTPPDDRKIIKTIVDKTKHPTFCNIVDKDLDTEEHINAVGDCQAFIGHKTHSVIFALATGTPVIALAYHPKTIDFMTGYGLSNYAIPDKELSTTLLIEKFADLTNNLDRISNIIWEQSKTKAKSIIESLKSVL